MSRRKRKVLFIPIPKTTGIVSSILLFGLLIFMWTYELPTVNTSSQWSLPLSGKIIAIDPGHGGPDGGAVSQAGLIEKDVTLAIALKLRSYLQQAGAIVVLTRETDADLAHPDTKGLSKRKTEDLHARLELMESKNTDFMVSIHLNSIRSPKWSGSQTFYSDTNEDSIRLAHFIQAEMIEHVVPSDREPLKHDTMFLLKQLEVPSTLIEVGFLSNLEEASKLGTEEYQNKVATAIYRGILRYVSGEGIGTPS